MLIYNEIIIMKSMTKKQNFSKIIKKYKDKWIALSPDYKKVISSGLTLKEAESNLAEDKKNQAVFLKVILSTYAPTTL